MDPFCSRVAETIDYYEMLSENEGVVVAVSGGPDSTALLHALFCLAKERRWSLAVAHLNHALRGEDSDKDEDFARTLAKKLNLRFFSEKVDVRTLSERWGTSLEDAGRRARYDFLGKVARQLGARIAVGHNRDDQAETVLMNLLRGSGMRGLAGIPPVRDNIIRPLIREPRAEIEAYCERLRLKPRMDITNLGTDFRRNWVRNALMPWLESEYNPSLKEILSHTADVLRQEEEFLDRLATEKVGAVSHRVCTGGLEGYYITQTDLLGLPVALQRRVIRRIFTAASGGKELDYEHTEMALASARRSDPNEVSLPNGLVLSSAYGKVFLGCKPEVGSHGTAGRDPIVLELGSTWVAGMRIVVSERPVPTRGSWKVKPNRRLWQEEGKWYAYMDSDRVMGRLILRTRRAGDRFQPVGTGTKKLKDYLIDRKIPSWERDNIPLLVDENGIVGVIGMDVAERVKVSSSTQKVLVVTVCRV